MREGNIAQKEHSCIACCQDICCAAHGVDGPRVFNLNLMELSQIVKKSKADTAKLREIFDKQVKEGCKSCIVLTEVKIILAAAKAGDCGG